MTEQPNESTGELVPISHHSRTVDMRERVTDSWTDVLHDVATLARGVAPTEFVPTALRCKCGSPQDCKCGGVAKTSAAVLYARELGLQPMTGLGSTHVIEGKAGISAEMMRALVLQAGHDLVVKENTRERCEIWGRRKGSDEWTKAVWTIQEAQQVQVYLGKDKGWGPLASKSNWRSWPADMLLARATTRLVRMIFPDVAHGMRSVEELQDMTTTETEVDADGVVADIPAQARVQRKRAPLRRPAERPQKTDEVSQEQPAEEPAQEQPEGQSPKVQRRRVAPPAPKSSAEPQQPAPQAVEQPQAELEVVDAEVVEDTPATAAEPPAGDEDKKSRPYRAAIQTMIMHWERLGVTDRAERLWYTGIVAGRELESSNDLTLEEARQVVTRLERSKNIDAINALVDKSEQGRSDG